MKQTFLSLLLILWGSCLYAQHTLSLAEFLTIVSQYHPVAKHASLDVAIAKTAITTARGAFDPKVENTINRKELNGLLYYDHQVSELKIPTWYGIEVTAGVESLNGQRTATPDTKGNSSFIGFSVPVAKGLLMDSRRAALQQAKIMQQLSLQEQQAIINDLLYQASKAYWTWWQHFQSKQLFQQAITNTQQRFDLVKKAFQIGERPAIDTIEALAQWQSIQVRASEIELDVMNALLDLSTFLWQQNGEFYTIPAEVVPQAAIPDLLKGLSLEQWLQQVPNHPLLQQYRFKEATLQLEKKLKLQSLLPSVYLKYHQLNQSHSLEKSFTTPWLENNYRYGVAVSVPLRLSEGRGEYRKAKLKIQQNELERINKQILQQTKVQQYYNEWQQWQRQATLQQQAILLYTALQKGEELKFTSGESSLFLLNTREIKTLEARQKSIELQSKVQQAAIGILWATGQLIER